MRWLNPDVPEYSRSIRYHSHDRDGAHRPRTRVTYISLVWMDGRDRDM